MQKELGKISRVEFGLQTNYPFLCGLYLQFEARCLGVSTDISVNTYPECKWESENQRNEAYIRVISEVARILKEAKKDYVHQLKGVPVELTFDGNMLKDWRILTEVL